MILSISSFFLHACVSNFYILFAMMQTEYILLCVLCINSPTFNYSVSFIFLPLHILLWPPIVFVWTPATLLLFITLFEASVFCFFLYRNISCKVTLIKVNYIILCLSVPVYFFVITEQSCWETNIKKYSWLYISCIDRLLHALWPIDFLL